MKRPTEIHTSDRQLFRRCRRKWDWRSALRSNYVAEGEAERSAPWIGTGIHFALEDFHGRKRFPNAVEAFRAYMKAYRRMELPDTWEDDAELAAGMLNYYERVWLPKHPEPYETLVVNGEPQVEVEVKVDITDLLPPAIRRKHGPVLYVMTFDRVVQDRHGRIYGLDYKTAAKFASGVLALDTQVSAYHWGLAMFYQGLQVEGIIWQQHLKAVPDVPRVLKDGTISQDKRQATTYALYRAALIETFGAVPNEYVDTLNHFAAQESAEGDRFIQREVLHRSQAQMESEQTKIVLEVTDMLTSWLPLYPNPTRDCSWDCEFQAPCLMTDDGSNVEEYMAETYVQWAGYKDDWRARVEYP